MRQIIATDRRRSGWPYSQATGMGICFPGRLRPGKWREGKRNGRRATRRTAEYQGVLKRR